MISDLTRSQTFDDGDDEVFVDKSGKKGNQNDEPSLPQKSPTQQETSPKSVSVFDIWMGSLRL